MLSPARACLDLCDDVYDRQHILHNLLIKLAIEQEEVLNAAHAFLRPGLDDAKLCWQYEHQRDKSSTTTSTRPAITAEC